MKQCMPKKPIKRGFKIWCLCDSQNGYAYNAQPYTGASEGHNEDSLGSRVVKALIQPVKGKGHHVYMDNFFTSVQLAKHLLKDNTKLIGTLRTGRKGRPQSLKDIKGFKKTLKRGESQSETVEGGIVECLVWKDNSVVPLVNTICSVNYYREALLNCVSRSTLKWLPWVTLSYTIICGSISNH